MSNSQIKAKAANTLSELGWYQEAYEGFIGRRYTLAKGFRDYRDIWAYSDEEIRLANYWLDICEKEEI